MRRSILFYWNMKQRMAFSIMRRTKPEARLVTRQKKHQICTHRAVIHNYPVRMYVNRQTNSLCTVCMYVCMCGTRPPQQPEQNFLTTPTKRNTKHTVERVLRDARSGGCMRVQVPTRQDQGKVHANVCITHTSKISANASWFSSKVSRRSAFFCPQLRSPTEIPKSHHAHVNGSVRVPNVVLLTRYAAIISCGFLRLSSHF